jgi:hypothetical protein
MDGDWLAHIGLSGQVRGIAEARIGGTVAGQLAISPMLTGAWRTSPMISPTVWSAEVEQMAWLFPVVAPTSLVVYVIHVLPDQALASRR